MRRDHPPSAHHLGLVLGAAPLQGWSLPSSDSEGDTEWGQGSVGTGHPGANLPSGGSSGEPGTAFGSAAGDQLSVLLLLLLLRCCLMPFLPSGLTALLLFNSFLLQLIRTWGEGRAASPGWTNPIIRMSSAGPRGQEG